MSVGAVSAVMVRRGQPDPETIRRMLSAVPHRGETMVTTTVGDVTLGIAEGRWAFLGEHGPWRCALLGPLDNGPYLARELAVETENPADVVAAAFARWGGDAASRLRGAFAGIASDGETAWAFRDHIGGRTFFYRDDGDTWWGATEAKQVIAGAGLARRPDLDAVTRTYYRGTSPDSALLGVKRLMYGSLLTVDGARARESSHWDPDVAILESRDIKPQEAREELTELLTKVVGRHVHGADAVALSGGIDSPVVAAFAAPAHVQRSGHPLGAYTFVYPEHATVDESKYTRLVAEALDMELSEVVPTASHLDDVERWVYLADGPWDSTPMAVAAQGYAAAADIGATQVLTGTLAEYVFTINRFLLGHLASHGRWGPLRQQLEVRREAGRTRRSLAKQLARELTPAPLARLHAVLRRHRSDFFPLWTDPVSMGAPRYVTALRDPVRQRWSLPVLQATRGTTTTSEAIEACAASVGVTVRHPLADRDLWEFFLTLPVHVLYPDTIPKSFVRQTLRGRLPDEVLDRRDKTVFDENVLASVPWEALHRYLHSPDVRIRGIDYTALNERLKTRNLEPVELIWAYDLATVHAFLESC
jgi:asparagine synthase (glutamine-hydrolysing)